jgi:hypothetical protein
MGPDLVLRIFNTFVARHRVVGFFRRSGLDTLAEVLREPDTDHPDHSGHFNTLELHDREIAKVLHKFSALSCVLERSPDSSST